MFINKFYKYKGAFNTSHIIPFNYLTNLAIKAKYLTLLFLLSGTIIKEGLIA